MVIWLAAILLIAAVALFIAAPLTDHVGGGRNSATGAESERREHEHALALQALRELEFDHAMGKLDSGDYRILKERLENRALAAMNERQKASRQSPPDSATPVAARSAAIGSTRTATVNFCPQCGTEAGPTHKFCANCGAALLVAATAAK